MDTTEFRERHVEAMLTLAQDVRTDLAGPRQRELTARVTAELPNLRAVTTWLLDRGDTVQAITLHASVGYYWYVTGREAEGAQWTGRVIDSFDAAPSPDCDTQLALALGWHGWLGMRAGTVADPWQSLERLRALHRSTVTPHSVAVALTSVAAVAVHLRPSSEAWLCLEEAEKALAGVEHPWVRAVLDAVESDLHRREGDLDAAVDAATANLRFFESIEDVFGVVYSLLRLGDAEENSGHHVGARTQWARARDMALAGGAAVKCGYAELRLAYLDIADDPEAAIAVLDRVRVTANELAAADLRAAARNLLGLAHLRLGHEAEAVRWFRAAAEDARALPIRAAGATSHLTLLDGPVWTDEVHRAVERISDPLHQAALRALSRDTSGLDEIVPPLPDAPPCTALAALV
jgi:hypothetical protein